MERMSRTEQWLITQWVPSYSDNLELDRTWVVVLLDLIVCLA